MYIYKVVYEFWSQHELLTSTFQPTLVDGFFVHPISKSNADSPQKERIIQLNVLYLDFYKQYHKEATEAVLYFMKQFNISFEKEDNLTFNSNLAILSYFMAIYTRRFELLDVPSLLLKWSKIEPYLTKKNVKKLYAGLFVYLTKQKGLQPRTAREILTSCDVQTHHGLENILVLLNLLEAQYYPETAQSEAFLRKRLVREISSFRERNPFKERAGKYFEEYVDKKKEEIKKNIQEIYPSSAGILVNSDSSAVKKFILKENRHGLKIPDYLYFDDTGRIIPVDAKLNLTTSNPAQISKQNLRRFIGFLNLVGEVKRLAGF